MVTDADTASITPESVRVRALMRMAEGGAIRERGTIFETTAARAAALGTLVERIS